MSEYLRYVLKNIEPLRIADDSSSQSGQTNSLRYIPGSAVRGLIVSTLAKAPDFEEIKQRLFSNQVRYLNAYPLLHGQETLPSPKGFYESKVSKGKIENVVVNGSFTDGFKRADLGRFARLEGDSIRYCGVETGSDMKIQINGQKVFRSEYMKAGTLFGGYIAVDCPQLKEKIRQVLSGTVILGNARSSGFGKCQVLEISETNELPAHDFMQKENLTGSCYLILLSHTVMRDENGEYCGIALPELEREMGVSNLKIAYCATSVVDVRGYNRTSGAKLPSVTMYEQGSVFHLTFDGTLTVEKMRDLMDQGIGVRRNEGFGRLLFPAHYEEIKEKEQVSPAAAGKLFSTTSPGKSAQSSPGISSEKSARPSPGTSPEKEDEKVLRLIAGNYYRNLLRRKMREYIVDHPLDRGKLASSQLGNLEAFTTAYKYDPVEGKKAIDRYFGHAKEKESSLRVQKERASVKELASLVDKIFTDSLEKTLGMEEKPSIMGIPRKNILSEEEIYRLKMDLVTELIRYENKEEVR